MNGYGLWFLVAGRGDPTEATTVTVGCMKAGQTYTPRATAAETYTPQMKQGQTYTPGASESQAGCC